MKYIEVNAKNVPELSQRNEDETRKFFAQLKKKKPKQLDSVVARLHDEAFQEFDCLDCANCCSNFSPIITEKDIDRLAKHMKMKPPAFIDQYLHVDNEGDYVFNETPCPFLMPDNYCMVYESRPKACREYPHTNRRKFIQILNLTQKNREACPIVYKIVENLKEENW